MATFGSNTTSRVASALASSTMPSAEQSAEGSVVIWFDAILVSCWIVAGRVSATYREGDVQTFSPRESDSTGSEQYLVQPPE